MMPRIYDVMKITVNKERKAGGSDGFTRRIKCTKKEYVSLTENNSNKRKKMMRNACICAKKKTHMETGKSIGGCQVR